MNPYRKETIRKELSEYLNIDLVRIVALEINTSETYCYFILQTVLEDTGFVILETHRVSLSQHTLNVLSRYIEPDYIKKLTFGCRVTVPEEIARGGFDILFSDDDNVLLLVPSLSISMDGNIEHQAMFFAYDITNRDETIALPENFEFKNVTFSQTHRTIRFNEQRQIADIEPFFSGEITIQAVPNGLMSGPRLTDAAIKSMIVDEHVYRVPNTTLVICSLVLRNGYIATGQGRPVDDTVFDYETSTNAARKDALNKVKEFASYIAREKLATITPGDIARMVYEVDRAHVSNTKSIEMPAWEDLDELQSMVEVRLIRDFISYHGLTPEQYYDCRRSIIRSIDIQYPNRLSEVDRAIIDISYSELSADMKESMSFMASLTSVLIKAAGHLT